MAPGPAERVKLLSMSQGAECFIEPEYAVHLQNKITST